MLVYPSYLLIIIKKLWWNNEKEEDKYMENMLYMSVIFKNISIEK